MKMQLKIQQKIQFFIISASVLIYIVAIGYISYQFRNMALEDAKTTTNQRVKQIANDISGQLTSDLTIVKTLAQGFLATYRTMEQAEWQELYSEMYREIFKNNPHIYSIWDSWELNMIQEGYNKPYGRFVIIYWRENGMVKSNMEYRSMDGDPELYAHIKTQKKPSIWEPYFDVFTENKADKFLMTTLNAPMIQNGQYVGIVAIDITLDRFQKMMEEIKPYEGSKAFMLSNGGIIAGHPNNDLINTPIDEVYPEDEEQFEIKQNINKGETFGYVSRNEEGKKTYYAYAPVYIGETGTPWSIAISAPVKVIMQEANRNFLISLFVGIFGILILGVLIHYIGRSITQPISKITGLLNRLAKGHISDDMKVSISSGDEIAEMSEALNTSVGALMAKQEFAKDIGNGKLDQELNLLSNEDSLGQSLIEMRNSLIKARKEEEERKIDDEKRKWANEGLAKFADILRQNNDDLKELAFQVIMNLVNYLDANQGGIFIRNENEEAQDTFELLSAFAYDRRKYLNKTIELGEGLIGTCAIEKKPIFLTDIPQDYINIQSGLGGANPNSIFIVPLKLEEEILGVIEIASFNVFEEHEREFIIKVAESIASTLNSVRINLKTSELLERSQQQAEEMAAQEEEMRQNMEELQATQEESARKSAEMEGLIEALNTSSYVIEYDLDGYIQNVNDNYLELLGLSRDEVLGTHHSGNIDFTDQQKRAYDQFWNDLRNGKVKRQTTHIEVHGKKYIFAETYTPIRDAEGEVYKILKISNNVTDIQK